jgi:CheY-like chemotaxis protein/anti-sigma regulatory factor (Ser/Thr protein kinase)
MEIHPVPTDITALINKVTTSFDAATTRVSVRLTTEIQKMPWLKLDPQRIRQILFNLIGNAVKFTSRGFVTIRATYENRTFTLAVADTGCGISEDGIKKLMSPYVQLHEHDSSTGTGLGLAICKQLSTQMKGTLEITSTLGKGSTFTLRVPNVDSCSEQETETYANEHNRPKTATHLDDLILQKNILIVDDQKLNQSILRSMLSRLGIHNVVTASNGKEALDTMTQEGNVDLVLTDMFMPVMDGETLVSEIRKSPELAKIPVYAITADVEMLGHFKEKGFDDMLIKPITLEKLQGLLALYKSHEPSDSMES